MKSLRFEQFGDASVLKIVEEEIPIPNANECLIKVKAVGINPLDWKIRSGQLKMMTGSSFPKYLGCEFSGVVEKNGTGITENIVGKKIFGFMPNTMKPGALREYICVPRTSFTFIPEPFSFEEAAAGVITSVAAYQAIKELAQAQAGQSILINGCTGGIGLFAIQIANRLNLKVTGVASSEGISVAKEFGCENIIDYKKTNILTASQKYDIILELSGRMPFSDAKKIMNTQAIYVNPSPSLGTIIHSIFHNLFSSQKIKLLMTKYNPEQMNILVDFMKQGLKIKVNKVYSFQNVIQAYQESEKRSPIGKNVVKFE